ncbi:MAG: exodeoxyribonuclease VII large subunit [Bacteroidia bacterium]
MLTLQDQLLLSEFLEQVQDKIRGHFSDTYSVVAEIASLSGARHMYFELIEKEGGQIKAKCRANLWAFNRYRVIGHFQNVTRETLKPGMKVLLRVQAEFHVQYGFSLNIVDIDPSYSLGEFERIKQETIKQLAADGLIDLNKELELPFVLNRLAIVTSATAAGYQDFIKQLENNVYAYTFNCQLFECLVQGEKAPESIIDALNRVEMDKQGFDAIILIRGGGSVIDLSCFDDYELNTIIAQSTYPVLTGIGHDRDVSVADRVAHTQLKTPTATAEFIIDHNSSFEQDVLDAGGEIANLVQQIIEQKSYGLEGAIQSLRSESQMLLYQNEKKVEAALSKLEMNTQKSITQNEKLLDVMVSKLKLALKSSLSQKVSILQQLETTLELINPMRILEKGYTLTLKNSIAVKPTEISIGDEIETVGKDFILKSTVTSKAKNG